jgi:hypothetical protein
MAHKKMSKHAVHKALIAHLKKHENASHPHAQGIINHLQAMSDMASDPEDQKDQGSDEEFENEKNAKGNQFSKMAADMNAEKAGAND